MAITNHLKIEEIQEVAEKDKEFYNQYMASAPPYEEVMKAHQEEDLGARQKEPKRGIDQTKKVKTEPTANLPYNLGDKVPGSEEDQKTWTTLTKRPDQTDRMILIYKNPDSKSKSKVKQLCSEYLTKLGFGNLEFPSKSFEHSEGAYPDKIWGYVLRYMKNNPNMEDPNISIVPKATTNASFIKKDVKQIWLDQRYVTKNANPHLKLALLLHDAHIKEPRLNEIKSHFGTWDESVMTFLYTVIAKK